MAPGGQQQQQQKQQSYGVEEIYWVDGY